LKLFGVLTLLLPVFGAIGARSGVGQFTCSTSDGQKSSRVEPFSQFAQGVVQASFCILSFGDDEDPFAILGRTNFSRREYSPRWFATAVLHSVSEQSQFGKDFTQSEADVAFHIFKEDVSGSNNLNCPPHKGPQMSRVVGTASSAGRTERLARIARDKDINQVSKEFAWEGFNVRPNRKFTKPPAFNF